MENLSTEHFLARDFMEIALNEAKIAGNNNDVPIGTIIVKDGKIIAKAHNEVVLTKNPLAHSEIIAINAACRILDAKSLNNCDLYVTLEPCPMCAGSGILARLDRVVYGAQDPKGGSLASCLQLYDTFGFNHYPLYEGGVLENECSKILSDYFRKKRKKTIKG